MIGRFISRHVYGGMLKTVHSINELTACRFVNVHDGKGEKAGNSFQV